MFTKVNGFISWLRSLQWKDIVATLQSVFTVAAIIVGGVWTFFLFIHNRLDRPRLQITQRISHIPISNDRNLLLVDEILSNPSSVLLDLKNGGVRVVQIAPLPAAARIKVATNQHLVDSDKNKAGNVWRIIEERHHVWDVKNQLEIEPGETDQLHDEFVLPANIRAVNVISYIYNPKEPALAWRAEEVYKLPVRRPLKCKCIVPSDH